MNYQPCKDWDSGYCYNAGLRNGLNSLACVGSDRCSTYKVSSNANNSSRIDIISSNGNSGDHYKVERICRIIAGDGADSILGGYNKGKRRWENHIQQASEILEVLRDE